MNSSMHGKVALVTGGSSGIARAAAVALAHEGATVVIASRQQGVAEDALQVIRQSGGERRVDRGRRVPGGPREGHGGTHPRHLRPTGLCL